MKMKAYMASELEFFLFDESYESAHAKGYRNLKTAGHYIEDYHILQTTKEEGVMRAIRNGLHGAGIPVENSKGEWGPGQEEINVKYAEALEMADRHAIMKNGCKEIAWCSARPSPSWPSGIMAWPAIPPISTSRCGRPTARPRSSSMSRAITACRT